MLIVLLITDNVVPRLAELMLGRLLPVQETQGMDFQTFFDFLQRCAEEAQLLDLDDEALDDWLPLVVVRDFLGNLNSGMQKVMEGIYPTTELEVA